MKHDAIDDTRHQVRYLVKAGKAILDLTGKGVGLGDMMLGARVDEGATKRLKRNEDAAGILNGLCNK